MVARELRVAKFIREHPKPKEFTTRDFSKAMNLNATHAGRILTWMADEEKVRLIRRGTGYSRPTVWMAV